jgi:mannose-6-phosphate isomerase-like protein (cupin superfamily)
MELNIRTCVAAGVVLLSVLWAQDKPPARRSGGGQQQAIIGWAPKKPAGWVAPNKPHTKLAEVLAKHKAQKDWTQTIVSDDYLHADLIQMAPGGKTQRRFHPDTREWWVVWDGQIKFNIEGQEPFIASKGYLVQVPYRNVYSMETVGDKPSLRFEVNIANARTMYPVDETPPRTPGITFVRVRLPGKGKYDQGNKPYLDFNAMLAGTEKQRRFIADDRAVGNVILGYAKDLPPTTDADKGHFHEECSEFWFILAGKVEYKLETVGMILADEGDVVYAPRQMWHRPRWAGDGPSCRLAMNGYQDIGHLFEATDSTGGQ